MQRYAFPRENGVKWRRENQWTACEKVHTATINSPRLS